MRAACGRLRGAWWAEILRVFALFSLIFGWAALALGATVPKLTGPVMDPAGVLSEETRQELAVELRALHRNGQGPQLQIYLPRSLEGEPIEDVAYQIARSWRLGDAERDDGVLLLIAPRERQVRIETGKGVGDRLTDVQSARIIREQMAPKLAKGQWDEGVRAGVQALSRLLTDAPGEAAAASSALPVAAQKELPGAGELLLGLLLMLLFLGAPLVLFFIGLRDAVRAGGFWGGVRYVLLSPLRLLVWLLSISLNNGGRGGGGRGGGGGGWSGGGGGFGGGGASGKF